MASTASQSRLVTPLEGAAPVLVSGVYRSGTTFLAAMLGAHPKLSATSSTVKFLRFCFQKYGDMLDAASRRALVEDTRRRIETRWNLSLDADGILRELDKFPNVGYARVYDTIMRQMLTRDEADVRWVEKLAMQWSDVPIFLEMFPDGRVLHIVRDPRDVTASYKAMTFEPGNTFLDAAFNCRSSMEHARLYERDYPDRFMLVRAEDLAANPDTWVRQLCDCLGLDFDDRMLDPRSFHADGEEWSTNSSFNEDFARIRPLKPRWPEHLSRSELLFVELITQPFLTEFGYEHSGCLPVSDEWNQLYGYTDDPFLGQRFERWLREGKGSQGYRTDPYTYEMKLVFPERFENVEE